METHPPDVLTFRPEVVSRIPLLYAFQRGKKAAFHHEIDVTRVGNDLLVPQTPEQRSPEDIVGNLLQFHERVGGFEELLE